jgi:hypothetical protein
VPAGLLLKILDHDMHRSKKESVVPLMIEVPALQEFVPAIVSNNEGKFLVARKLTNENRIRVGVFKSDPDKVDNYIPALFTAARELSIEEKWCNRFKTVKDGFKYVEKESYMPAQPHVCFVPSSFSFEKISKMFGIKENTGVLKYNKFCRIIFSELPFIMFLSRPDMVGLYTHFLDGPAAIVLHNVKRGISFVEV